jgi:hypothetical protein
MSITEGGAGADLRQPFVDMALESWRFAKVFGRILSRLDASEAARHANQMRYFLKRVDESMAALDMRIVSLEGQLYDPGMAASPLNIGDFGPDDVLVVEQMLEPVIMGPQGLVKAGTVLLKLAEGSVES